MRYDLLSNNYYQVTSDDVYIYIYIYEYMYIRFGTKKMYTV